MVEKYPKLFFSVRQYDSREVLERILSMEAEVGLTGMAPDKGACAFEPFMQDQLVLYGTNGKIIVPRPHCGGECFLYDNSGALVEHFTDTETQNGFTYEIEEAMRCIREGLIESPVVPHQLTLDCARLFDRINQTK